MNLLELDYDLDVHLQELPHLHPPFPFHLILSAICWCAPKEGKNQLPPPPSPPPPPPPPPPRAAAASSSRRRRLQRPT